MGSKDKEGNKKSECKLCVRHKTRVLYDSVEIPSFSFINSGANNIPGSHCLKGEGKGFKLSF